VRAPASSEAKPPPPRLREASAPLHPAPGRGRASTSCGSGGGLEAGSKRLSVWDGRGLHLLTLHFFYHHLGFAPDGEHE
jgi:hypothetical protein